MGVVGMWSAYWGCVRIMPKQRDEHVLTKSRPACPHRLALRTWSAPGCRTTRMPEALMCITGACDDQGQDEATHCIFWLPLAGKNEAARAADASAWEMQAFETVV